MDALGKHFIVELFDCNRETLNDTREVEDILNEAVHVSKATRIKSVFHKFAPHGVSGVVVIAESHFSIHTWPEYGYCAIDIFTCGETVDNHAALKHMKNAFQAGNATVMELKRGVLDFPEYTLKYKPTA